MGLHVANQTSFKPGQRATNWNGFRKGSIPWNKGLKIPEEKTARWKGDNVGYFALHAWVRRKLGKPKECEFCLRTDEETNLHWANRSRTYKRDIADWISLCVSCHKTYDLEAIKKGGAVIHV